MEQGWRLYDTNEHDATMQALFGLYTAKMTGTGGSDMVTRLKQEEARWKAADKIIWKLSLEKQATYADFVTTTFCNKAMEESNEKIPLSCLLSAACEFLRKSNKRAIRMDGSCTCGNMAMLVLTLKRVAPDHVVTAAMNKVYDEVMNMK